MRLFFGIEWRYGRAVYDDGTLAGVVVAFTSKKARDEWVKEAEHIPMTNPGARDPLDARTARRNYNEYEGDEYWRYNGEFARRRRT